MFDLHISATLSTNFSKVTHLKSPGMSSMSHIITTNAAAAKAGNTYLNPGDFSNGLRLLLAEAAHERLASRNVG
jgi:hypothetical protein